MNFFEHQHRARRRTAVLTAYFLMAVVLIVAGINVAVYVLVHLGEPRVLDGLDRWLAGPHWRWLTAGVLAVIALGSLVSWLRLRGGGEALARMVGARRVDPASRDPDERRLVNVAEEMAIASGTPAPVLYVMEGESAINAFVAGYRIDEAVLVVTRGALESLGRDELQGVVAHEFSHVLNGDMRMNVRLIAVLAGILVIGQLGGFLLRSMRYSSRRSRGGGGVAVLGLVLFIVGYVGLFFGRLIKAAISRQREFLADASAVQFTRNPGGIAGALWKIREHAGGSRLAGSHAEDMSHMCFGETVRLSSLLATHPPLQVRIETIDPSFEARRLAAANRAGLAEREAPSPPSGASGFAGGGEGMVAATPEAVADSVGSPSAEHVTYARAMHEALPASLLEAARAGGQAPALIYALVLAHGGAHEAAVALIAEREGASVSRDVRGLAPAIRRLGAAARLPLLDVALPALRALDRGRRDAVLETLEALVHVDERFTLFEFVVLTIARERLRPGAGRASAVKYTRFAQVLGEVRVLLTVLARAGAGEEREAAATFARAMRPFIAEPPGPVPAAECTPGRLTLALRKLAALSPLLKRSLINACADCVLHDGKARPAEAELLRATAVALECPMPPLLRA